MAREHEQCYASAWAYFAAVWAAVCRTPTPASPVVPVLRTCEKATWNKLSLEGKNGMGGIGLSLKVSCVCQLLGLLYEQYVNLMEFFLEISLWAALVQLSKNCHVGRLFSKSHSDSSYILLAGGWVFPLRPVQAGLELVWGFFKQKKKYILPVTGKGRNINPFASSLLMWWFVLPCSPIWISKYFLHGANRSWCDFWLSVLQLSGGSCWNTSKSNEFMWEGKLTVVFPCCSWLMGPAPWDPSAVVLPTTSTGPEK